MSGDDYIYLLWPEIELSAFNAMGNPYVIGAPGPTAIAGWGHALERMLRGLDRRGGSPGCPLRVAGSALIVHHADFDEGRPLFPAQLNDAGANSDRNVANKGGTPSMVEEIKGHGRFSLLAAVAPQPDADEDDLDDALDWLQGDATVCRDWATWAGLAGGAVHAASAVEVFATGRAGGDSLLARLAGLGGAALIDRADLLNPDAAAGSSDPLDRLLDALAIVNEASDADGGSTAYRRQSGWLVPYPAGFKAIESPKQRRNAVGGYPHAYGEPLLGLGEYLSVPRLVANQGERLLEAFWRYAPADGVHAVRPLQTREDQPTVE
jgi:CRISPR type I-F-associated protein Csy2